MLLQSWPKLAVKNWLSTKNSSEKFNSEYSVKGETSIFCLSFVSFHVLSVKIEIKFVFYLCGTHLGTSTETRKSCSDQDSYILVPDNFSGNLLTLYYDLNFFLFLQYVNFYGYVWI
jgi:hypothetical protein